MICVDTIIWYGLGFVLEVALNQFLGTLNDCFLRSKDLRKE